MVLLQFHVLELPVRACASGLHHAGCTHVLVSYISSKHIKYDNIKNVIKSEMFYLFKVCYDFQIVTYCYVTI